MSLSSLSSDEQTKMIERHQLFKKGDKFLETAGINRDWPENRGIFISSDNTEIIWVNEEDQLRIIALEKGANLKNVFYRLKLLLKNFENRIEFSWDKKRGYLTSCPTNIGTGMRASMHIKLKHLSNKPFFKTLCDGLSLDVRGINGEHSENDNGVFDISNKERLGVTEKQIISKLLTGVNLLLAMEKEAAMK